MTSEISFGLNRAEHTNKAGRKLAIEHFRLHKDAYEPCITLYNTWRGVSYIQWGIYVINTAMACVFPRLDPTLAYPVPLRPSVFQHARFIDKMQPGATRVKQEKYEIFQEEPLKDGM